MFLRYKEREWWRLNIQGLIKKKQKLFWFTHVMFILSSIIQRTRQIDLKWLSGHNNFISITHCQHQNSNLPSIAFLSGLPLFSRMHCYRHRLTIKDITNPSLLNQNLSKCFCFRYTLNAYRFWHYTFLLISLLTFLTILCLTFWLACITCKMRNGNNDQ